MRHVLLVLILVFPLAALAEDGTPKKQRVLVMDLSTTGVDDETAALVSELVSVRLSGFDNLEIYSGADVRRLIELEANKAAVGCEDTSCLADIAGALGARYVIYGRMGKLGSRFIVTLNLFDADTAKAVQREDIKAESLDQLSDELSATTDRLIRPLVGERVGQVALEPPPESNNVVREPVVREPEPTIRGMPLTPILLIGAGAAIGVVGLGWDAISPTSYDNRLGLGDFIGPIGYVAAIGLAVGGAFALEAN